MHLQAVLDCLPAFATAGHFHYLESARYYLQDETSNLDEKHSDVYLKLFDVLTLVVGAISARQDLVVILSLNRH